MKKVIELIEGMQSAGVIDAYALGGAMAANLYIDSLPTLDFDFFVHIVNEVSSLDPLRSIIDYLEPLGYSANGVEFDIDGFLVQFIPFTDELTEEATYRASEADVAGVRFKAFSPEYLVAIMLKTSRGKDLLRAKMFVDQGAVSIQDLERLIERFDLGEQWRRLQKL